MSVVFESHGVSVATLTLDAPERLNSLDRDDIRAGIAALDRCENDGLVRCLVIRGEGRAFCSGADLGFIERIRLASPEQQAADLELMPRFVQRLATLSVPTIAAVQGAAFGGGACLALACDDVVLTQDARLGLMFTSLGLPGGDSLAPWLLTRRVGTRQTWRLLASGAVLDAADAATLGLADEVVPADDLTSAVTARAQIYIERSRQALSTTKRQILRYEGLGSWLEGPLSQERDEMLAAFNSPDLAEGMAAHRERRSPKWP